MRPHLLTQTDEAILRACAAYRYMTAEDVGNMFYRQGAFTHARALLRRLSGEQDFAEGEMLYRFRLPDAKPGNRTRIYTLGTAGRAYVEEVLGMPVAGTVRPEKARALGYYHLQHSLALTRVLVATGKWCREEGTHELSSVRTSYELSQLRQIQDLPAIPDAWLLITRLSDSKRFPLLLEIDNGTEYRDKFKAHVKARLTFLESEQYREVFGLPAVTVVYLTLGGKDRRDHLKTWTEEVLKTGQSGVWRDLPVCQLPCSGNLHPAAVSGASVGAARIAPNSFPADLVFCPSGQLTFAKHVGDMPQLLVGWITVRLGLAAHIWPA